MTSSSGAAENFPYLASLNASSTARGEGANTRRPVGAAPASAVNCGMRSNARCSFAVMPCVRKCVTRRTNPASRCSAPSSRRNVVLGSALETTQVRLQPLARFQNHARRAVLRHDHSRNRRREAKLGSGPARRPGERLSERAETADGLRQRGGGPTPGREAIEQREHAARRSRPRLVPSTASKASAPLRSGLSKCSSSRSCTHIPAMRNNSRMSDRAQQPQLRREAEKGEPVAPGAGAQPRRHCFEKRSQRPLRGASSWPHTPEKRARRPHRDPPHASLDPAGIRRAPAVDSAMVGIRSRRHP